MRTLLHYESTEIPAKALVSLFPSDATMKSVSGAQSYRPSKLKVTPGPFIVTLAWEGKSPSDVFKFDLSNAGDGFDLVRVSRIPAGKAIEICVENTSNEPASFEAAMSVETQDEKFPRHPVDVMSDDMAEDYGQGPLDDVLLGGPHDPPSATDCFPKGDHKDRLREAAQRAKTWAQQNIKAGRDPMDGFSRTRGEFFPADVADDTLGDLPNVDSGLFGIGRIVKSRVASIVDNVLRAVEVVVRDAADKLDGSDAEDDLPPVHEPLSGRDMVLGFSTKDGEKVPPGASANITVRPQVIFKMRKLIIPDAIADAFDIADIKIGKNSQFATANSVPGATFAASKGGETFTTDTAQVSMDVTICVFNKSSEAVEFKAAAVGSMVEGGGYNPGAFAARLARARKKLRRTPNAPFGPFFS